MFSMRFAVVAVSARFMPDTVLTDCILHTASLLYCDFSHLIWVVDACRTGSDTSSLHDANDGPCVRTFASVLCWCRTWAEICAFQSRSHKCVMIIYEHLIIADSGFRSSCRTQFIAMPADVRGFGQQSAARFPCQS